MLVVFVPFKDAARGCGQFGIAGREFGHNAAQFGENLRLCKSGVVILAGIKEVGECSSIKTWVDPRRDVMGENRRAVFLDADENGGVCGLGQNCMIGRKAH
jgi:hypothetical protein